MILEKSQILESKNQTSKFFTFKMIDDSNHDIKGIAFNNDCTKFFDSIEVNFKNLLNYL